MFDHIYTGGVWFMVPIVILGTVVIVLSVYVLAKYFSGKVDLLQLKKHTNLILFLGSFAFLLGLLAQVIGLLMAFMAIERAGDISIALIAQGLQVSFIAPLYGFGSFLISLVVWFIKRNYLLRESVL